ncbi:MAG: HDOD domain-containing protein [Gammaproteobacteria bacterium]
MNAVVSITDLAEHYLESEHVSLPVYPKVATLVQEKAREPNCSAAQLARVLAIDPVLSGQVMKAANSSFYGGLKTVDSVSDAIVRLGFNEVASVAVMCAQRDLYRPADREARATMRKLWQHAVATAFAGRWLATRIGFRDMAQDAFMAGLFHDVGKLGVIQALDSALASGQLPQAVPAGLRAELIDRLHPGIGARIVERWNLAPKFAKVAREHHLETIDAADTLLVVVRLADLAAAKLGFDVAPMPELSLSATEEAALLQVQDVTLAEMLVKLEDGMQALGA